MLTLIAGVEKASLQASRCLIREASTVLADQMMALHPGSLGQLVVPEGRAADWEVVLQMISLKGSPLRQLRMSNVAAVLQLAGRYDMPCVRDSAVDYLLLHTPEMDLYGSVGTPANLLRAASLVFTYCHDSAPRELMAGEVARALKAAVEECRRDAHKRATLKLRLAEMRDIAPEIQALAVSSLVDTLGPS